MDNGKSSLPRDAFVFGIPITALPQDEIIEAMDRNIRGLRQQLRISITSGELMYNARRVEFLPEYIRSACFSLCDSTSVVLSAFLHGAKVHRFTGPMLMEQCAEYGIERGWRHFFCGGAEGIADLLSRRLSRRFPGLQTAGTFCPPFRELSAKEEEDMCTRINAAHPDILWIGLGVVKQELWIAHYGERLNVPWTVGVGGAFDYHAATVRRAPAWIRRIGMEWSYRLWREPWRYKRILSVYIFMCESILAAAFGRAPVFGGKQNCSVQAPAWKGKGNSYPG